jgi:hypothetical protein
MYMSPVGLCELNCQQTNLDQRRTIPVTVLRTGMDPLMVTDSLVPPQYLLRDSNPSNLLLPTPLSLLTLEHNNLLTADPLLREESS